MISTDKIEDYFIQLNLAYKKLDENLWSISDEIIDNVIISYEDPVIIIQLKLMEIPKNNKEEFFLTLLKLNATSLVHGAYGIEDNFVILIDSLQASHLNLNELQASLEAIKMALLSDYKILYKFHD